METERKYLDVDLASLRERLRALGATSDGPHFESNIVFDTPTRDLFGKGCLLRLRTREWRGKTDAILTYKYPCASPPDNGARVKVREELEVKVESAATIKVILGQLGFLPSGLYEKVRESWRLKAGSAASLYEVELDLLPFGDVVEIEGDPQGMDALADLLGLDKRKISLKTYHDLNEDWRRSRGLETPGNLLFEPDRRRQLRTGLDLEM